MNTLEVRFSGPLKLGRERRAEYFLKEGIHPGTELFDERSFVRLPAHRFGWDWGPGAIEFGLLSELEIQREKPKDDAPFAWLENNTGHVSWPECPDAILPHGFERTGAGSWKIDSPRLWWPRGEGEQHLYEALDPFSGRSFSFGFRSIEIVDPFAIAVNGRKIFARGLNWTPTARGRFAPFEDFGQNMVRIWGGGEYPDQTFMQRCDEEGVLVWMDFPYACGYVPESGPGFEAMEREAYALIKKHRHHPSLALWSGNNENDIMWDTKWGDIRPEKPYGEGFFHDYLPEIVPKFAPYIPSSPMRGERDTHYWDVWHGKGDWTYVKEARCHFASEFGFASYTPGLAEGLKQFRNKSGKNPDEVLTFHYRTIEDSNLNQRDAVRAMIEHFRLDSVCAGALLWQSHEPWAGLTWAIAGKPAAGELPRLLAPTLVGIKNGNEVWAIHHGPFPTTLHVTLGEKELEAHLEPWEAKHLLDLTDEHPIFLDYLGFRRVWLPCEPKVIPFQNPVFEGRRLVSGLAIDLQIGGGTVYNLRPGESVPPGRKAHWKTLDGANGTFPETL